MAQVIINVEDDEYKEIVEKGIRALKPEQLQETIVSAIGDFLRANNYEIIKNIFIYKPDYRNPEPTLFFRNILNQLDYSELQEILSKIIDELSNNYKEVLVSAMSDLLISRLSNNARLTDTISDIAQNQIYKYVSDKENGRI